MTRRISRVRADLLQLGRYVVIHSDDDERWTVEFGDLVYSGGYGPDLARSNVVTPAKSPQAAIERLYAPAGRVFRVLDIDSGDVHEFVVDHVARS
jgi:hypothetical protein